MPAASLGVALAAAALAPAAAHADSISFLRGGDIWVASADGAKQVQVTTRGGYTYQSRADDGSFIALHGRQLHRLTPTGQLVAEFNTPVSFESAPGTSSFSGPFKPEISPDGSKVAYEYYHQQVGIPGCTPTWECNRLSVGIGYSYADRNTSWDEPGLGRQSGWTDPSWIDDATLLMSDKSVRPNADAILDHPGDGNDHIEEWFEDTEAWYLRDAEVSRRGDAAAFVSTKPRDWNDPDIGQQDDQVAIYRMNGPAPALPEGCFAVLDADRVLAGPSFAPDGRAVAFSSAPRRSADPVPPRIEVLAVPSQAGGCATPSAGSSDLIANAANPDWSPAPVPTMPESGKTGGGATTSTGPATGGGTGGTTTGPDGGGTNHASTVVTKRGLVITVPQLTVAGVVKQGLRSEVQVPSAGSLRLSLTLKGRTIADRRLTAKAAGTLTPRLTVSVSGRRAIKQAKRPTVTLRYAFTPKHGKRVTGTAKLTLGA